MGPRALVLALLPTAVAANKGNEVIKFVVIGAAVLIFFGLIIYRQYKYATWSAKRSTTVTAPAGKAGLLFDETTAPPTVTGLAALSPLRGEVQVGWRLAKVDDVDVSEMTGGEATRLLEARAATARRDRAPPRIRPHASTAPELPAWLRRHGGVRRGVTCGARRRFIPGVLAIRRVNGPSLAMATHPSNSSSFRCGITF